MAEENESQQENDGSQQTEDSAEEPSMDEILGSIREILSDDGDGAPAEGGATPEENARSEGEQTGGEEPVNEQNTIEEQGSAPEVEPTPEPEPAPEPEPEPELESAPDPIAEQDASIQMTEERGESGDSVPVIPPSEEDVEEFLELTQQMIAPSPSDVDAGAPILSGSTQTASTDPLQELAKALLNRRDIAIGSRDMTLEGLIREILRPLLREWLDENLPYLIERLVKKEIDHMVNRAERLDL